jgi:hypothetical protein
VYLLAYSPELQLAERLWSLCDEPLVNRTIESLGELKALLSKRCRALDHPADLIPRHTCYHWWPRNE